MFVSDIMTEKPVTISQCATVHEALEKMEQINCHHLPVLGSDNHLVGIVTDHDCHIALNLPYTLRDKWRDYEEAKQIQVKKVMTPAPIIVEPGVNTVEAARLMLVNHVSCLPVMRGETLIGIITNSDILMAYIKSSQMGTNSSSPFPQDLEYSGRS